jgi:uncharacterized membrane protein
MSRKKSAARPPRIPRGELTIIRLSLGVALVISLFLAWSSFQGGAIPGCGPDSSCDRVLGSRWSRVFGISVTLPAILVYGVLLAELFRRAPRWNVVFPLASLLIAAAIWFTVLQAAVLKSFCPYCMAAHAAGVIGAVLLIRRCPVTPQVRRRSLAFAALSILLLSGAQVFTQPPLPAQIQLASGDPAAAALANRYFAILNGQVKLDLARLPMSGPVRGTNRVVKLFDYTCHHCRELHHLVHQYARSNDLTVISLPVPLDKSCNPLITRSHPDHANACEYARLGLAVFFADATQFAPFSDWLYAPARPPSLEQSQTQAEILVGREPLAAALRSSEIDRQLRTNIAIYQTSSRLARSGQLPQLIFENSASIGSVANLDQLEKIMAANLSPASNAPIR